MAQSADTNDIFEGIRDKAAALLHSALKRLASKGVSRTGADLHAEQHQAVLSVLFQVAYALGLNGQTIDAYFNLQEELQGCTGLPALKARYMELVIKLTQLHNELAHMQLPRLDELGISLGQSLQRAFQVYARKQLGQGRFQYDHENPRLNDSQLFKLCQDAGLLEPQGTLPTANLHVIMAAHKPPGSNVMRLDFKTFMKLLARVASEVLLDVYVPVAALGLATRPRPLFKILQAQAKVDLTRHWNLPSSNQPISDEAMRLLQSMPTEVPADADADTLQPDAVVKTAAPGGKGATAVEAAQIAPSALSQLMERMDSLQAEVSVLHEKNRIAEHRGNAAQDQMMQMQAMLGDMAARDKERSRGIRGDMERFMADLTRLQQQVATLTDRVKTLEESVEEQMDTHHTAVQRVQERLATVSRKVDQVATDKLDVSLFGELQGTLETLSRDKINTDSRLTHLEASIQGKMVKPGAGGDGSGADQPVAKKFSEQVAVFQAETAGQLAVQRETTKNLGAQLATVQADIAGQQASVQESMQQIQQQLETLGHRVKEYTKQEVFDEFASKVKDELSSREAQQGATELAFQHIVVQIQQLTQHMHGGQAGPMDSAIAPVNKRLPLVVPEEDEDAMREAEEQEYGDDFEGAVDDTRADLEPETPVAAPPPVASDLQPDQERKKVKKKKKKAVEEELPLDFSTMNCVDGEWYEGEGVVHGLKAALEVYVEDYDPDAEALTAERLIDCPGEFVYASDWDTDDEENEEEEQEECAVVEQPQYVEYAPVQRTRKVLVAPVAAPAEGGDEGGAQPDDGNDLAPAAADTSDQSGDQAGQEAEGPSDGDRGSQQQEVAEPVAFKEARAPREGRRPLAPGTRPGVLSADPAVKEILQGMLNDFARQMGMEIRLDQLSGAELEAAERLAISLLGDRAPEVLAAATRKAVIEKGVQSEEATACGKELVVVALTGSDPEADVAVRLASGILGPGHLLTQTAAASAIASRSTSSFMSRPPEFARPGSARPGDLVRPGSGRPGDLVRPGSARPASDGVDGANQGEGFQDNLMAVVMEEEEEQEQGVEEQLAVPDDRIHAAVRKAREALLEHGNQSEQAEAAVQGLFDVVQEAAAEGSELSQTLQQMIESAMSGEAEAAAAIERAAQHLANCVFSGGTNRHNVSQLRDMMSLIYGDNSAESLATAAAGRLTDATLGATTAEETQGQLAREALVHASGSSVMAAGLAQVTVQAHGSMSEEATSAAKHVMRVAFSEAEAQRAAVGDQPSRLNSRMVTGVASVARSMSCFPSAAYSRLDSRTESVCEDAPTEGADVEEAAALQPTHSVFADAANNLPDDEPVPEVVVSQQQPEAQEEVQRIEEPGPAPKKGVRVQLADDGDEPGDRSSRFQAQRGLLHKQRSRRVYRMDDDGLGCIDPEVMVRLPAEVQQLAHAVNALVDITRETRATQKEHVQAAKSSNTVYSLSVAVQEQAENVGRQGAKLSMLEAAVLKVAKEMDSLKNSMQQEERRPFITVGAPAMPPMNRYSSFRAPSAMSMGPSSYARTSQAIQMEPDRPWQSWDTPQGHPGAYAHGPPPMTNPHWEAASYGAPDPYQRAPPAYPAQGYMGQQRQGNFNNMQHSQNMYEHPAPAVPAVADRQQALEEDILKHASFLASRQGEAVANAAAALNRSAAASSSGAIPSMLLNSDPHPTPFDSPQAHTSVPDFPLPRAPSGTGAWPGHRMGPQPPADPNPYNRLGSTPGSSPAWPDTGIPAIPRMSSGGGRSLYPEQQAGALFSTPSTPLGPRPGSARFSRPMSLVAGSSPLASPSAGASGVLPAEAAGPNSRSTDSWGRSALTGPVSNPGGGSGPRTGALTADPVDDPRKLRSSQPGSLQATAWQNPASGPKQEAPQPVAPAQPSVALAAVAYGANAMQNAAADPRFAGGKYRKL